MSVRSLAHPVMFEGAATSLVTQGALLPTSNDVEELARLLGTVVVSRESILKLLKRNETVLLYPGGSKEALNRKGEEYQLFWPSNVDFIRMAALCDSIIVPVSAIGLSESINVIWDSREILDVPIIGSMAQKRSDSMPQARPGLSEELIFPVVSPALPERLYYLFLEPIDTRGLNIYNKKNYLI